MALIFSFLSIEEKDREMREKERERERERERETCLLACPFAQLSSDDVSNHSLVGSFALCHTCNRLYGHHASGTMEPHYMSVFASIVGNSLP